MVEVRSPELQPLPLLEPGLDPQAAGLVHQVCGEGQRAFDIELVDLGVAAVAPI
jgi:hypothetical protein